MKNLSVGPGNARRLLHIDSAYTLEEVRTRGQENFFMARHASGLFQQVWSIHPVADAVKPRDRRISVGRLGPNHAVIEGKAELCHLPRWLRPLNFLISQFALYRLLARIVRREAIDVIVAVDPFVSGLLGLAVARTTGRPLVLRVSGNHEDLYEAAGALAHPRVMPWYWLQRAISHFVFKHANLVSAINRNNLSYAVANGAGKATAIIPVSANVASVHRIDPARRPPCDDLLAQWGVPSGSPVLLYYGRLITLKHPDDAIRAMASVINSRPEVHGIIAGGGVLEPQLRDLAVQLGASRAIHFVGSLDQDTLSRLIPRCVVISPSAGQLAVLESALGGAPIVAYDRDFQPEFIEDGVDGFIVPFRDYVALAEKAAAIVTNPSLARQFSTALRRKALQHTDPEYVRELEWAAFAKVFRERA